MYIQTKKFSETLIKKHTNPKREMEIRHKTNAYQNIAQKITRALE